MADSGAGCIKREPKSAVRCTKGENHKGPHGFGSQITWTDEDAQQILAILAAGYGGIVSWPPGDGRKRPCGRCKKEDRQRECSCCGQHLCFACIGIANCAHSHSGQHALPVERPT